MVACWFRTTEKWRGGCRAYYVAENVLKGTIISVHFTVGFLVLVCAPVCITEKALGRKGMDLTVEGCARGLGSGAPTCQWRGVCLICS